MSTLRDPTIKLFGKTIPLSPPKLAAGLLEVSVADSNAVELAGIVQFEVCDDESSKEVEEIGDFDEKNHYDAEDHQGESGHKRLRDGSGSSGIIDLDVEGSSNGGQKNCDQGADKAGVVDGKTLKRPDKILSCPRCNSMETKFCYFNNYNVSQPRHFCKKCQRYWTAGGSMRNVPVGSGRRKSKSSSGLFCRQVLVNEASMQSNQCIEQNGVLRFGSDAPLCDSMANVLNIAENRENGCQNGGEYQVHDKRIHMMGSLDAGLCKPDLSMMGNENESQDVMKNCQGYPIQMPFYPGPQWAAPWNPAMPPQRMGLAGYPVACYSMPNYWTSGMMGSWVHPSSISSRSNVLAHNLSSSSPHSPTLGKHSRDGKLMKATNSDEKVAPSEPKASRGIWVPKALRIDDPSQAAKSSIWETLGIQNEKSCIIEGGIFRGNYKLPERPRHLHTNPAALSRSRNFNETTSLKQPST